MTYVYYDPYLDCIYLTTYHWGKGTTMLPEAFDGEYTEARINDYPYLFEYLGKL